MIKMTFGPGIESGSGSGSLLRAQSKRELPFHHLHDRKKKMIKGKGENIRGQF